VFFTKVSTQVAWVRGYHTRSSDYGRDSRQPGVIVTAVSLSLKMIILNCQKKDLVLQPQLVIVSTFWLQSSHCTSKQRKQNGPTEDFKEDTAKLVWQVDQLKP